MQLSSKHRDTHKHILLKKKAEWLGGHNTISLSKGAHHTSKTSSPLQRVAISPSWTNNRQKNWSDISDNGFYPDFDSSTSSTPAATASHTLIPPSTFLNLTTKCFSTPKLQSGTCQKLKAQPETGFCDQRLKNSRKHPLRKKQFRLFSEFEDESYLPCESHCEMELVNDKKDRGYHTTNTHSEIKYGFAGLKGGGNETVLHQNIPRLCKQLKLVNPYATNACFINASVQLFRMTGYTHFILGLKTFQENQKISKALCDIYTGKQDSVKSFRMLMAHFTKKTYYDDNSQQDSVEFLEDLEVALYDEIGLNSIRDDHWGSEELTRLFSGNKEGSCLNGHMPVAMNQEFLFLKLTLKDANSEVTFQQLIDLHFSSSMDIEPVKCSNCCQCSKKTPQIVCTFSGDCKKTQQLKNVLLPCSQNTSLLR